MSDDWPGLRNDPADRWHFDYPERLQEDPPPRSPWLFRACLVGVALVVGVLWLAG